MNCPYPDCPGRIEPDDAFCGECGRSVAPAAVQSFLASRQDLRAPGRPPANRMPLILGGVAGLVLLLLVGGMSVMLARGGATPTPTATVAPRPTETSPPPTNTLAPPTNTRVPPTSTALPPTPIVEVMPETFTFDISDLTEANNFTLNYEVRAADGSKRGLLTFKANYQYKTQGSPELMGTVVLALNSRELLELAASNQPIYASSNPGFEVPTSGDTYERVSQEGWLVLTAVDAVEIDPSPVLADGTTGTQPVFTRLSMRVNITSGAGGAPIRPTLAPEPFEQTYSLDLQDLTPENGFAYHQELRAFSGRKLGLLTFNSNYNYSTSGAPELIGTVEIRLNNEVVLELAASNQPLYASTNPAFEVAEAGRTYTKTVATGMVVTITVDEVAIEATPLLPSGRNGDQPVFSALKLTVAISSAGGP